MRLFHFISLHDAYRRLQHRNWIKRQLTQAGGADYLRRLEEDIGAEPRHFRNELEKPLFTVTRGATVDRGGLPNRQGAGKRPARWTVTLPAQRLPAGKC